MLWQDSTVVRAVARKLPESSGCRVVVPGAPHPQTVSSGRLFKGSPTGGLAGTASSPPRASAYSSSRLLFFLRAEIPWPGNPVFNPSRRRYPDTCTRIARFSRLLFTLSAAPLTVAVKLRRLIDGVQFPPHLAPHRSSRSWRRHGAAVARIDPGVGGRPGCRWGAAGLSQAFCRPFYGEWNQPQSLVGKRRRVRYGVEPDP